MKAVQEALGEHQDSALTRARLRELARSTDSTEAAFLLGRLHALEEARAEGARAAFWALEPTLHPMLEAVTKKR